ncbi:MAG: hypothetical protein K0U68_02285 [Gammaproteobacteria bacterium]|nr:hypothetical protein [Gammaproteobacteria bacterium]
MNGDLDFYNKVSIPYQEVITRLTIHSANWQENLTLNVKKLYSDPGPTLNLWFESTQASVKTGVSDLSGKISAISDNTSAALNRWAADFGVGYDASVNSFGAFFNRLSADPTGELSALFVGLTTSAHSILQSLNLTVHALPGKLDATWSNTQVLLDHAFNLTASFLSQTTDTFWLFLTSFFQQPGVSMNVIKYDMSEFGIHVTSSFLGFVLKII